MADELYRKGIWYNESDADNLITWCIENNKPIFAYYTEEVIDYKTDMEIRHECTKCHSFHEETIGTIKFRNFMTYSGYYFARYTLNSKDGTTQGGNRKIQNWIKTLFGNGANVDNYPFGFISAENGKMYFNDAYWSIGSGDQKLIDLLQRYHTEANPNVHIVKFFDEYGVKIGNNQYVGDGYDAIPQKYYPKTAYKVFEKWSPCYKNITHDVRISAQMREIEYPQELEWDNNSTNRDFHNLMWTNDRSRVVLGIFNADFEKTKQKAYDSGVPLLAMWSPKGKVECGHCTDALKNFLTMTFREWLSYTASTKKMYFYYGCAQQGLEDTQKKYGDIGYGPSADGKEGYRGESFWALRPTSASEEASFPFIRILWNKGGQQLVDVDIYSKIIGLEQYHTSILGSSEKDVTDIQNYTFYYDDYDKEYRSQGKSVRQRELNRVGRMLINYIANPYDGILRDYFEILDETTDETYYKVSFLDYDNSLISEQTVLGGGNATPPLNPKRRGYTFGGWDPSYNNITSDTSCVAQYNVVQGVTVGDIRIIPIDQFGETTTKYRYSDEELHTITFSDNVIAIRAR